MTSEKTEVLCLTQLSLSHIDIFRGTSEKRGDESMQMEVCKPAVILGLSLAPVPNADTQESCLSNAYAYCLRLHWFDNVLLFGLWLRTASDGATG